MGGGGGGGVELGVDKQALRFMVECAYLFCWGANGSADLRDSFKQYRKDYEPLVGEMTYCGGGGDFRWIDVSIGRFKERTDAHSHD